MQRFTSRTLVVHDEGHACALKIKFFPQISGKKIFPQISGKKLFPQISGKKLFPQISGKKFFFRKKNFSPDFRKHRICVQNLVKQKFLPSKGVKPFKDFAIIF